MQTAPIIIAAVYIPPQASTEAALSDLCKDLNCSQTSNPDTALTVAGDFNQANLKKVMPEFHQHIDCAKRGINTLDHWYAPFKDVYGAESLLTFGNSGHLAKVKVCKQTMVHALSDAQGQEMDKPIRGCPTVCTT